ncbi:DNA replication factor Cdt1 [Scaptodrosophila lebanonensis]|uniref:DNA replication factor Cdt1 n=1 Tax=Drosophila lebanonensis TaxID=7225 RepID=A0A6J2UJK0_DROLE|nr:DNA replication factor Cdt1 [Scaptodrosophila lebanonensis]
MAQPSVAAFFSNRKRAAVDDAVSIKTRRLAEPAEVTGMRTRSGRSVKLIGVEPSPQVEKQTKQQKLVQFVRKASLSPRKPPPSEEGPKAQEINEHTPRINTTFASKQNATNVQRGMRTPTKQIIKDVSPIKHGELKRLVKKELTFDEVKAKVSRSAKLQELKASLARIQQLEQTRKAQEERNRKLREAGPSPAKAPTVQLKEFDTIELEVLASPSKTFKTPTKLPPPTPDKHELMSPRHTDVSKRLHFSPAKNGSPVKLVMQPAYQRFMSLAETSKAGQLPLPYKYRHLIEIFKGVDSVVAMFHNRKECITFKKLKPAVQRMLRKNFTETHLAQIKHIYPDAFIFSQMKMRNYGSVSKADYFQLVISPNVEQLPEQQRLKKINEDDVLASAQSTSMNPHIMTARMQRFQSLLMERVKDTHDKFIRSLDPPLSIDKHKVTRWHPDFDLESCPEVERGALPQPPNVEKYSSARDILSTARNLFNCATPMERAMQRYEAKLEADRDCAEKSASQATPSRVESNAEQTPASGEATMEPATTSKKDTPVPAPTETTTPINAAIADGTSNLLKGLPKSLIEKIRAKQAAKALDAMTRRPSQDQEATKYSRLPELARHLRNVFVTERKSVLTLEIVIKKIQNSFRTSLTPQEIETHLKLLAKEMSVWVTFHEVRKTMYLKIAKDLDMNRIIEKLEGLANERSK